MSAAKAFLRPAMKRPNLTVRTHAHVTRILFDGVTAAGVEYAGKGFCYKVRAEKEVILCGGVINSPQLLQLSGIGARDVLEPLGIRNLCDSPAVGRNLQDHLGVDEIGSASGRERGWPYV